MGFKDKLKDLGGKLKDATANMNISVNAGSGATNASDCIHCGGNGVCKFCHGSGKLGALDCVHCHGSGDCFACHGKNRIREPQVSSRPIKKKVNCIHCHNSGDCFACHGSGKNGSLECIHCHGSGLCHFCQD